MTLLEVAEEMDAKLRRAEAYWDRQYALERERKEKAAAKAKKAEQTRNANYSLNKEITRLRKLIRDRESAIQSLSALHSAFGFANAMMEEPLGYYSFQTLYWSGIREGELMALTLEDIDFKEKTIRINKTYQHIKGRDIITDPKTPKSNRIVQIPDFLVSELKDYVNMIYDLDATERLFPVSKSYLYRMMKKGSEAAGLTKIRVHDLRHSHVSLLIHMGFSAVAIADRVGHESVDITYRYSHMFPSVQKDMADKLNQMMEGIGNV
jgi:integrase